MVCSTFVKILLDIRSLCAGLDLGTTSIRVGTNSNDSWLSATVRVRRCVAVLPCGIPN